MGKLATIGVILAISLVLTVGVYAKPVAEKDIFFRDVGKGKEKVAKLHFYVQDLRIGNALATVFEVANASITHHHPTAFGSVHVLDDLMTEKPEFNSRPVGRTQGLTTNADLTTFGVAMNLNFYFTGPPFNGSTLCILGRNDVLAPARELPVVGGTGAFRYTRGYAIQTTYSMDFPSSYAVLEYTIYTTYNNKPTMTEDLQIADI